MERFKQNSKLIKLYINAIKKKIEIWGSKKRNDDRRSGYKIKNKIRTVDGKRWFAICTYEKEK